MRARWNSKSVALVALLALLLLSFSVAQSQQRRRTSRRVTHPVRTRRVTQPQPTPVPQGTDPTLVSTADESNINQTARPTVKPTPNAEQESARRLERLSTELNQLNRKFDALEKERQADLLQERLTRAEQGSMAWPQLRVALECPLLRRPQ